MKNMGRQREFYCFKTCDSFVRYDYERQVSNSHHIIFSQRYFTTLKPELKDIRTIGHRLQRGRPSAEGFSSVLF